MTNQIPEEDKSKIFKESYKEYPTIAHEKNKTFTASESSINDFCRSSFMQGAEYGYHLGLQSAEKEIERLKGLIWGAYQAGEDGMIDSVFINDKGDEILYSQTETDRYKNKFKTENNL